VKEAAIEADAKSLNREGLLSLSVVYVVWSSTYLAIRVAVRPGSGFPPFTLGATRLLVASTVLIFVALAARQNMRVSRNQLMVTAASGLLLWVGGNGLVNWAEQTSPSGFAALMLGSIPLWAALIQSVLDREKPTPILSASLACGFLGVAVLSGPSLIEGASIGLVDFAVLLTAAASWGLGSVLQTKMKPAAPPLVSSAYQQLFGAGGMCVVVLISNEQAAAPTADALLAWAYLIVFGSILAFTCYVTALRLLPTRIAMTYAYVNPILAVVLGAVLLHETVTLWVVAGAALIVLGVAGVFRSHLS